ncbi:dTDP-4-dehydrorhamnose 3,5-epimerase family protein [Amycolatopsis suaedae]|uniref:dTDP-4-keto-6-deoxy-D-glucose epimerase n=1 Tax=Amycolatopsis suaedae TaxID=2510978 RepID=A0A4Q7J9J7_9PSEU|nr:dTDP-4-dehydrorhamnose 3,5-epimerase [Amycolatopsis suaedae]RZQ63899.1 dTDP-4-keto-6-deoxy-D-glucose epimerase [Amycolatopsis suaedae]
MKITELSIPNAYRVTPARHPDRRGSFHEAFRSQELSDAIGYPFVIEQASYSTSCRNTVRGIHGTTIPPGQAKLITCVRGAILDVAVDLRVGSPTFGTFELTRLDEESGEALYLADGIGHGYVALTDNAGVNYLQSEVYVPGTMIRVDPFDAEIGIPWNLDGEPVMSDSDATAPSLREAMAQEGLLPRYEDCLAHYVTLKDR